MNPAKRISIVIPVYNEASNLEALHKRVCHIFNAYSEYAWEMIFVDDGSMDDSWVIATRIAEQDDRVVGVRLSRNFGKEMALTAGVDAAADSDAVICMDADLQHPPELISEFIEAWREGCDIVYARRESCEDYTVIKKIGSRLFYAIMSKISDVDLTANTTDFRLLDRKVVDALQQFSERNRIFRGIIDWMGFKKKSIAFTAPARQAGSPGYSYQKLFLLAINSFTSFSLFPLRLSGYLGLAIIFFTSVILLSMLGSEALGQASFTHMAYFIVLNTFLIGVTLCALGMIALYIGHIHTEVVNRPLYIVSNRIERKARETVVHLSASAG